MYPLHASNFPRTASFARNVPGETTSEHYTVIVLPNCIGAFVVSATNLDFFAKRWCGLSHQARVKKEIEYGTKQDSRFVYIRFWR